MYVLLSVCCSHKKKNIYIHVTRNIRKSHPNQPKKKKKPISRSPTSPSWQEDETAPGPGNASTVSYSKQNYSDTIDTRSLSIGPMENMKSSPNHQFLYDDKTESIDDPNKTLTAADSPKTYDRMSTGGGGGGGGGGSSSSKERLQNDYDVDGNTETETKSVSSIKSNGSNQELRYFHFVFDYFCFLLRFVLFFFVVQK